MSNPTEKVVFILPQEIKDALEEKKYIRLGGWICEAESKKVIYRLEEPADPSTEEELEIRLSPLGRLFLAQTDLAFLLKALGNILEEISITRLNRIEAPVASLRKTLEQLSGDAGETLEYLRQASLTLQQKLTTLDRLEPNYIRNHYEILKLVILSELATVKIHLGRGEASQAQEILVACKTLVLNSMNDYLKRRHGENSYKWYNFYKKYTARELHQSREMIGKFLDQIRELPEHEESLLAEVLLFRAHKVRIPLEVEELLLFLNQLNGYLIEIK